MQAKSRSGHGFPTSLLDGFARTPIDADVRVEVFDELHCPQQVAGLEQGLKARNGLVECDRALSEGAQLFLRRQGTKETSAPETYYRRPSPASKGNLSLLLEDRNR